MAASVKKKMASTINTPSEGEYLRKALKADLKIVKVQRNRLRAADIQQEDLDAADKWRKQVIRVMGVLKNKVERRATGSPSGIRSGADHRTAIPVLPGRGGWQGLRAGHLRGHEQLHEGQDLQGGRTPGGHPPKALDFPFVKLKVQGWSSKVEGGVILYDYPTCRGNEGLVSPESNAGGVTPLSHAIQLAGRTMLQSRNERHIFLISDGYPVYKLKGRNQYMKTEALREWTRDAVMELRQQRINVWCWMLGNSVPDDASMDFMFGPRNWKKIDVDDIYRDGFDFLSQQFLSYLRTR